MRNGLIEINWAIYLIICQSVSPSHCYLGPVQMPHQVQTSPGISSLGNPLEFTSASEEELKQLLPAWTNNKMNKSFHATSTIFDNLLSTSSKTFSLFLIYLFLLADSQLPLSEYYIYPWLFLFLYVQEKELKK